MDTALLWVLLTVLVDTCQVSASLPPIVLHDHQLVAKLSDDSVLSFVV